MTDDDLAAAVNKATEAAERYEKANQAAGRAYLDHKNASDEIAALLQERYGATGGITIEQLRKR